MADKEQVFNSLQLADGTGVALHRVLEGDAIAAKNAAPGLVAKDPADQFAYLQLNAAGEILVNTEGSDIACLKGQGTHAGDNAAFQDLAVIALTINKVYKKLGYIISCFRDTVFEIYHQNDAAEVILGTLRCGAGDVNDSSQLDGLEFTAGGVGVQELRIRAKNLNAPSTMDATVTVGEIQ